MFTPIEILFLIIIVCFYTMLFTWMFMKKMKLFGSIMIFFDICFIFLIFSEISNYSQKNQNTQHFEQVVTIESFTVLKNGVKIPIDTIVENIKIPITLKNY